YYRPQLVREIRAPGGEVVQTIEPELAGRVEAPRAWWEAIIDGMEGVVRGPRGTARNAFAGFPREYRVAGKTGSAEVPGKEVHGLCGRCARGDRAGGGVVGFIERGGGGGSTAAPVARAIFEAYFALQEGRRALP